MTARLACHLAATAAAFWAALNVATLIGSGVYFRPGGHRSDGMWFEASDDFAACALSMAIYVAAPVLLFYLGRREPD